MKNKLKSIFSNNKLTSSGLFIVSFFMYISRLAPQISGYANSDAFVHASFVGGALSSPHFSVLLTLMKLSQKLLWFLPPATATYVLSSFLGAVSTVLIYKVILLIEKQVFSESNIFISVLSRFSALFLYVFSYGYMIQSTIAERYMWIVFLSILSIYLLINNLQTNKKNPILLSILIGVGLSQHWTFIFLLILSYYLLLTRKVISPKSVLNQMIISIFVSFTIIFIVFLNKPTSDYSFIYPDNFGQFLSYYFDGYIADGFIQTTQSNQIGREFIAKIPQNLIDSFGIAGVFYLIAGMLLTMKKSKDYFPKFFLITTILLLFMPVFSYIDYSLESYGIFSNIRIISHSFAVIFVALGMRGVLSRIKQSMEILYSNKAAIYAVVIVATFPVVWNLYKSYPMEISQSGEVISTHILESLEKNSTLLCTNDLMCSSIINVQQVTGARPDVLIIPYYYNPSNYRIENLNQIEFKYKTFPHIWLGIVSEKIHDEETKIYSTGMTNNYWKFLGFDLGFIHYTPLGYFGEVSLTTPNPLPEVSYPNLEIYGNINDNLSTQYVKHGVQNKMLNAMIFFKSGQNDAAYEEMSIATRMAQLLSEDDFELFQATKNLIEGQSMNDYFVNSSILESTEEIVKDVGLYQENGFYKRSADLMRGAILIQPFDLNIRLRAGELYEEMELYGLAKIEYEIALQIDVDNSTAIERLESIKRI